MVIHFPAAPHHITYFVVPHAITCPTCHFLFLQYVDPLTIHLPVTHQVTGRGKGCQPGSNDIG